jgi:phosphate/sulfate permease
MDQVIAQGLTPGAPLEPGQMSLFIYVVGILAVVLLIWDTLEVGRNDAANIVNSVFGSRILSRENAVRVAAVGVILGAGLSSEVIETARKGIFDPSQFTIQQALAIYTSVYIVDTILLYSYSAFGMPVSTTLTLVFALLGASFFLGALEADAGLGVVRWSNAGRVLSGIMGFIIQRVVRGAIRDRWSSLPTILMFGGVIGGGLLAGLSYFMLVKGMKSVAVVQSLKAQIDAIPYVGPIFALLALWVVFGILIHVALIVFRRRAAELLFPLVTVIGMVCMAFAFGQNDLANCASPGLAILGAIDLHRQHQTMADIVEADVPRLALFGCGAILVLGMMTRNAQRVTRAEVSAGSQGSHVRLWAPRWCIALASVLLRKRRRSIEPMPSLAPTIVKDSRGKTMHYDPLRASVIICVSASVIATASSLKLPVSTTYVAFAAVVATGMADRIFVRGDAALKLGRSIWVVFSWFAAAVMASVGGGLVCLAVYYFGVWGMAACLAVNLLIRGYVKRRSDTQEIRVREEARERMHPEEFALEDEGM